MEMEGENIAGSFRVENGKIHSVKFEKTDLKLESIVVGEKFENWKEFIQQLEITV
jgi:hypothetical protein